MGLTGGLVGRAPQAARVQAWRDLGALLSPAAHGADPIAEGRPLDWHRIYSVAASHWVAPTLHAVLAASPQRWGATPADVQQALAELQRLNAARNAQMRTVLRQTVQCLNAAGIEPLLLKGSIALLPGQYTHAADRMVGDLDLALHNATAEQAAAVLQAAGYRRIAHRSDPLFYDRMHHLAPMMDPGGSVCIELHREVLARRLPVQALPMAAVRQDAQAVDWNRLRLWVPSLAHRLLHNVLHDAVQDGSFRSGLRSLRQLHELARLREQPDAAALDWTAELARLEGLGLADAVGAQLLVCRAVLGQPLPAGVQPGKAAQASERRLWFWVKHPGLWPCYLRARRVRGLVVSALTPQWYPSKWRQLRHVLHQARQ